MGFSAAQYEATIDELAAGLTKLSGKLKEVPSTVQSATDHWYISEPMAIAIRWMGDKLIELGSWVLDKLAELLKGAAAPVLMFSSAWDWEDVRGAANAVAGSLDPGQLSAGRLWHGAGADAYAKQITPQANAAARVGTMADKTGTSLTVCAVSGLAFYVALGVILVKFIAAFITALGLLGTAVFSWAGLVLVVEEAGVNTGMIIAAVSALTAVLGAQASQMVALHGEAVDPSKFPNGHWPDATPARFGDASVMGGHADWSLGR